MSIAHILCKNYFSGATGNWNLLAHWAIGFNFFPALLSPIIIIIITIFIEEAFSLKSGLQKGPQKIKNLQYWMLKMFKKKLRLRLKTNAKLKLRLRLKTNAS